MERKGRKVGKKRKKENWEKEETDGGGAVHLQIKFVIQASDGPTARD